MSTSPAKPPPLAKRRMLTFNEVLTRWQWTENDLKESVINGHLVPCIFERGAIWALRVAATGNRSRVTPAIFSNRWLYLIGVNQTGPFDCKFDYLADSYGALTNGDDIYQRDGNGYVEKRTTLADVIARGAFPLQDLEHYETTHGIGACNGDDATSAKQKPWWQTQYDINLMASRILERWRNDDRDVNQSGARAGKYSRAALGEAIAAEICKAEKVKKSAQTISGRSIVNYLKHDD